MRICKDCRIVATTKEEMVEFFSKNKLSKFGYRPLCKVCHLKRQKLMPSQTREGRRPAEIKTRYGISKEEYDICMDTSDRCGICDTKENLCYDHCHDTSLFRGVLCKKCNSGIGMFNDNPELIRKALLYLTNKYI